jgi:predicted dehydrogenase
MVGFNRRFSPFIRQIKEFFKYKISPFVIYYRINAGYLAASHWVHTPEGGGRIVGEVCHFVDLLSYITDARPLEVSAVSLDHPNKSMPTQDNIIVTLKFSDGSIATINYNSVGDIAFSRELIEIFGDNSVATLDNFKKLTLSCGGHTRSFGTLNRDMGHQNEIEYFVRNLLNNNQSLITFNELICTTLTTFKIEEALRSNLPVKIDLNGWTI